VHRSTKYLGQVLEWDFDWEGNRGCLCARKRAMEAYVHQRQTEQQVTSVLIVFTCGVVCLHIRLS